MANIDYPKTAHGNASLATASDLQHDQIGMTNPNLHRRVAIQPVVSGSSETQPRKYSIQVSGVNSYRATQYTYHNEDSEIDETP